MLGVTFTSRAALEEGNLHRKKDKKEKKSKKEKRSKKEKHSKKQPGNDSSESDSGKSDHGAPIEAGNPTDTTGDAAPTLEKASNQGEPAPQREDWMTKPMRREVGQPTEDELEEQRRKEAAAAEPDIVAGLRIMRKPDPAGPAAAAVGAGAGAGAAAAPAAGGGAAAPGGRSGGGAVVGDGGASWRLKALRRAQEQARAEGRSLQEVVGERWGSLAQLTQDLSTLTAADSRAHLRAAAERRRAAGAGEGAAGVVPHYLQDVRGDGAKMLRPSEDAALSWRRERGREREARDGGRDRDKAGDRGEGRGAQPGGGEEGAEREKDGRVAGEEGGGGVAGDRRRHEQGREREAEGDRDRGRERRAGQRADSRDRERDYHRRDRRDHHRSRDGDRELGVEGEGRGRGHERDGREHADRGQDRERQREQGRLRPSREQAAALQQLAGSLNSFADDGSFMSQFVAAQGGEQAAVQADAPSEGDGGRDGAGRGAAAGSRDGSRDPSAPAAPAAAAQAGPGPGSGGGGGEGRGSAGGGGSGGGGGGGGTNRAIAVMLRAKAGGGGGGGAAAGGAGAEEGGGAGACGGDVAAPAPRRAPLFVGHGEGTGGGGGGSGAGPSVPAPAAPVAANKSAAELLRARLKGLPPPPQQPQQQQDQQAPAKRDMAGGEEEEAAGGSGGGQAVRREVVQLPLVDAQGRAARGAFGREAAGAGAEPGAGRRAGTKPPERYNRQTGEKERYFADDDKTDLQTMLRRAKYGDDDMQLDSHLAANIAKKRKFRGTELDADAEYDYDGGLEMYESRGKRGGAEAQRTRDRGRQVAELQRQQQAEAGCVLCLNNPRRPPSLTVALGTCTQLLLPPRGRLLRGHCCIAPAEHQPSMRGLDEAAWTEVKNFVKCLIRMYGAQGQSVLFMETHLPRGGGRGHAVLDAVPVTERQLEKARGYFKKAILEAESEWSTHHAKACIETTAQKGLRESIPPNFPYFYVQFGYGAGYVHVIDDETKFDPNFGRQVLIGLLDLPPELAFQKQRGESGPTQQQWLREFTAMWDPYDWTRQLG